MSILDTFRKLRDVLEPRERRRALLLLGMILILALLETTSVASIMPFVAVLTHPNVVESNRYLSFVYQWLGFTDVNHFLLFLGFFVLAAVVGSTAFKALTTWATVRFGSMRQYTLSRRLFKVYLRRSYEWFLGQHSADLSKAVLAEVNQVISGALMPALQLVTQSVLAILVVSLLIAVDPVLALIVSLCIGGMYALVLGFTRRLLHSIGEDRFWSLRERYRITNDAFSGIKDVKLLGLEDAFLGRFDKQSLRFVHNLATSQIVTQLPQFAIQSIAISGVLIIILYQLALGGSHYATIALLALYAFAAYRLLPALQRVFSCISQMHFTQPALNILHEDLAQGAAEVATKDEKARKEDEPLHLLRALELRDVSYQYPSGSAQVVSGVTMMIPALTTVGLVGRTGAGKTTTVDLILGLLDPASGQIVVDGTPITPANKRRWQKSVGYVPQHIFLTDDTLSANIAFGVPDDEIDQAAVERAARIANLHDFVVEELEEGYATLLGERGVRLSGGQRQRVGIARALYRDPDVVAMDEATSALDNVTERGVMDAVVNLSRQKTVIIVAHRLTTVKRCDVIFVFDRGSIVASGTYEELVDSSEHFQAMVSSVELAG
jgi:ABC-type multidrug transport system fused ATPase/permease subunit